MDSAQGTLKLVETVPTQGKTPRSFAVDPSGKYLLAANQDSNNVVVFRIDPKTGASRRAARCLRSLRRFAWCSFQ